MKKLISILLVVAMLFSMSSEALAAEGVQAEPELLEEYTISTGTYYNYSLQHSGETWNAIIFMPNDGRDISFSATSLVPLESENQEEGDDKIYTLPIKPSAEKGVLDYLQEGFSSLQKASVINASDFDTSGKEVETRDSVQADLFKAMRAIYGNEFERVTYRNSTYPKVKEVAVHQDLVLRMEKKGGKTFDAGTALSAVSLAMSKIAAVSVTVSLIAMSTSVRDDCLAANATLDAYIVKADFGRWTTIDGGDYVYTMTDKIYKHCGINERYNEKRAYLQKENATLTYNPSSSYYNDYLAQTKDAYNMYLKMHGL